MKAMLCLLVAVLFLCSFSQAQTVVPIAAEDLTRSISARNNLDKVLSVVKELKRPINSAARAFGIDPIHIAAAIAGEHAINVSLRDSAQNLAARSFSNAQTWAQINHDPSTNLAVVIAEEKYQKCYQNTRDYDLWICIVDTWNRSNAINVLMGQKEFFRRFTSHFFNPNAFMDIGMTFGVGQMSPVRALMVDDLVAKAGRNSIDFLKHSDVSRIYANILDPKSVVYYVAATVSYSIAIYKSGDFDISQNPGLTATLYNNGNEKLLLRRTLRERRLPETNDLGKWVNQNIEAIRSAIN
jgi:hypothetical protein